MNATKERKRSFVRNRELTFFKAQSISLLQEYIGRSILILSN